MQIVIDIPKEEYKRWKEDGEIDALIVRDALKNGVPFIKCSCCKNFNGSPDNYCRLLQINWLPNDFGCLKGERK